MDQHVEFNLFFSSEDLLQLIVEVNEPSFFWILESIAFNILPQCRCDSGPCFLLDAEHFLQFFAQSKLFGHALQVKA